MCKDCGIVLQQGGPVLVIPTGGTYYVGVTSTTPGDYMGATATYTAGDNFPAFSSDGDVYVYGDYEYRYNNRYYNSVWQHMSWQDGWGVRVLDVTKTAYGSILSEINNNIVNTLHCTFQGCTNLVSSGLPEISNSIEDMTFAFNNCTSLVTPPTIPDSAPDLTGTFQDCTALTTAPILPDNTTGLNQTFYNCPSLVTYVGSIDPDGDFSEYVIPSKVVAMTHAFNGCSKITVAPAIPNTGMYGLYCTFKNCTSLVDISKIVLPSNIQSMTQTFCGCTSLVDASNLVIPSTVTEMSETFRGCNALEKGPDMSNATSLENLYCCFYRCDSLLVAPDLSNSSKLTSLHATFYNCAIKTYDGAPAGTSDGDFSGYIIPSTVTNMEQAFELCKSMTVAPALPNEVTNVWAAFYDCTALKDASKAIIPSTVTKMDLVFRGCTALEGTITINANPDTYEHCFAKVDMSKITLEGSSILLDTFGATGNNYCADCNGKCLSTH